MRAPFCSESPDFGPEEKDIIGSEKKNENEICAIEQSFQKARTSKTAVFGICLEDLMGTSPNIVPQIPFIISRICNFIETHGMHEKSLFLNGDEESLVENLREEFSESGDAALESTGHVASIAKLLVIFLEELPEPLIPVSVQPAFIKDIEKLSLNPMACLSSLKESLEKLPDSTYQVLKYLSHFLLRVTFHKEYNGLNSISLAVIFGPLIFRPSTNDHQLILSFRDIVNCFVKDYYTIFENGEFECQDLVSPSHLPSALSLKISRQPCPSSIMPVMSLSPLSVVIPTDKDKSNSENDKSGIPLLLIEGQPHVKCKNKKVTCKNKSSSNVIGIVLTRKRKERRFSGEDAQQRSSSEERPSPNSVSVDSTDAMRRCNSHEEVMNHEKEIEHSRTNGNHGLKFINSCVSHNIKWITNGSNHSPHPPTAKRREIETEDVSSDDSWISSTMDDEINQSTSFSKIEQNSVAESPKNTIMECDNLDSLSSDASSIEESDNFINSAASIPRSSSCPIPKSDNGNSSDSETESLSLSWSMLFEDSEPVRAEPHLNLSKEVHNETLLSPSVRSLRHSEYYEAPLSPSAFRSYLSYRGTHLDPSVPPSPPVEQENFAKKSVETTSVSDSIKQLTKKIHSIKKRIRKYDEKFEAEYGFKPSHAEKSNNSEVKKLLTDLYKARKELKALKEEAHLENVGTSWHVARPHILEDTTNQLSHEVTKHRVSVEESFGQTLRSLADERKSAHRPEAVDDMTNDQVKDEKIAIQKALLNYEKVHGKPVSREDRETCRPLYERYRCIKRLLLRSGSFPGGTPKAKDLCSDLQPILEHETMEFPARQKASVEEVQNNVQEIAAEAVVNDDSKMDTPTEQQTSSSFLAVKYDNSNLHELPLSEMLFHMQNIKSEKRRLRKSLKEFEMEFLRSKGKKVQKEDKVPVEAMYNEYKHIKARLKLLEALISKHDQHQLM